MKRILLYIILILPFSISAQSTLSNAEMRKLNYHIVDLVEDYEYLLQTPTDRARYEFIGLFESEKTLIYNDLLGLSTAKELKVEKYIDILFSNSNACKVVIKNLKKKEVVETDTHYLVDITFDKYIQYYNNCGVVFDSEDFYEADHRITATVAMDKESKKVLFRKIKGSINTNAQPLPAKYRVFSYNEPRDKDVLANGKNIKFNSFGQAFVDENAIIKFNNSDVELKIVQDNGNCNLYSFRYKPYRWRFRPKVDFTFNDPYKVGGTYGIKMLKSSSMFDFGADIGYAVVFKPKFKLSLFTGIGMSNSKAEFEQGNSIYRYYYMAGSKADFDGETYRRYYELKNMKAKMELTQIVVPLYLDVEIPVYERISAYAQFGMRVNFTANLNITGLGADMKTFGVYPQYNYLVMEDFAPNGFGNQTILVDEQKIETKACTLDMFGGLGCRVNLYKGLFFDAGLTYQGSVTPIHETQNRVLFTDDIDEKDAFITYSCHNGESIRPFTDILEKVTRGAWRANVGLLLKF